MFRCFLLALFISNACIASCSENGLLTQTVYGFLDFTTTIGNTVMVFSPQSAPPLEFKTEKPTIKTIIETKPLIPKDQKANEGINPTKSTVSPLPNGQEGTTSSKKITTVKPEPENSTNILIENVVNIPEYDLLSRQPQEYAEETYRVINLKSKNDNDRQKHSYQSTNRPNNKITSTVKAVQSVVLPNDDKKLERKNKPRPSSSFRITKTATPTIQPSRLSKDPPPTTHHTQGFSKPHRKNSSSNRDTPVKAKTSSGSRKSSRNKGKRRNKTSQVASSSVTPSIVEPSARRSFKTKLMSSVVEAEATPTQPAFKLNRRPGRWQYNSSPKPKVNIRKQASNAPANSNVSDAPKLNDIIAETNEENQIQKAISQGRDLEASGSQSGAAPLNLNLNDEELKAKNFVQTLNVEISTPNNFVDTYYEIATIKSPFIFQAGVVKKTRFITVTSTIEKVIKEERTEEYSVNDGPLTENILESTSKPSQSALDGSVTTLNPIYITDNSETPNLETITDTFSITQTKLKTQILPVIYEKQNETILITLVQTYDYTSLITVTQTVSPFGDNFIPSKNFKDFEGNLDEAGSELSLDLEFGDEDNLGKFDKKIKSKSKIDDLSTHPLPDRQLAENSPSLIRNDFNTVITSTRPVVKLETLWESHVVPLIKGAETILRTLSKSIGVAEVTEYVTDISTIPLPAATAAVPNTQFPFSVNPFYNPLLQLQQQPQIITSTEILQTMLTETNSKILKLTFGARTAFTTIYSTAVVPTAVTKLVTTALAIPQSGAFPNYYPPPYPPFPYIG